MEELSYRIKCMVFGLCISGAFLLGSELWSGKWRLLDAHSPRKTLVFSVITIGILKYYLVNHKPSVLEC